MKVVVLPLPATPTPALLVAVQRVVEETCWRLSREMSVRAIFVRSWTLRQAFMLASLSDRFAARAGVEKAPAG